MEPPLGIEARRRLRGAGGRLDPVRAHHVGPDAPREARDNEPVVPLLLSLLFAAGTAPGPARMRFTRAEDGALHAALRSWMEARSPGYRHLPPRERGSFFGESWCSPAVVEWKCTGGAVVNDTAPGTAWRSLDTLHYSSSWPEVFGVVASIGDFPVGSDLGVAFSLAVHGASIVGDGMSLAFTRRAADGSGERVVAGERYTLVLVDRQEVVLEAPGGWREEFGRLALSPDSLRRTFGSRLDALEKRALASLADGTILGFDDGPYLGRGIPPVRGRRPLREDERVREAAAVRTEIARRRTFVEANAGGIHSLLVGALPIRELLGR